MGVEISEQVEHTATTTLTALDNYITLESSLSDSMPRIVALLMYDSYAYE
jgi:hypothetical protein